MGSLEKKKKRGGENAQDCCNIAEGSSAYIGTRSLVQPITQPLSEPGRKKGSRLSAYEPPKMGYLPEHVFPTVQKNGGVQRGMTKEEPRRTKPGTEGVGLERGRENRTKLKIGGVPEGGEEELRLSLAQAKS